MVIVHCDKGLAIRIDPEPCAVPREGSAKRGTGEARHAIEAASQIRRRFDALSFPR